jgi:hypothetical protein
MDNKTRHVACQADFGKTMMEQHHTDFRDQNCSLKQIFYWCDPRIPTRLIALISRCWASFTYKDVYGL